jgi:hypothetical protein
MRFAGSKTVKFVASFFVFAIPAGSSQLAKKNKHVGHVEDIWNYDAGVFFVTDGSLHNGVCFRVNGRMTSDNFFNGLKRIDTNQTTIFQRGKEVLTKFPDSVTVAFTIHDELCPAEDQQSGSREYLTQKMLSDLRLSIYWKHGVELQPAKGAKEIDARVDRIKPYAASLAAELPPRYEWSYELMVPSAGVPLSDSLAFVFRTPDGRIAARVSARL